MRCRNDHDSVDVDYCSVCGIAMRATAPAAAAAPPATARSEPAAAAAGSPCPACGEPRVDQARYCEVCRYDFVAARQGPPPTAAQATPTPAPPPAAPADPPPTAARASSAGWELELSVDRALDVEPDPGTPCPTDEPARVFAVADDELLVGRRDDRRDIIPDVPLRDPGASRRHAKLLRVGDGALAVQDLASINGTLLNGHAIPAGSRQPLQDGDELTLGRWTRIRVRRRP